MHAGLLAFADSADEVAGVLAHEIAHCVPPLRGLHHTAQDTHCRRAVANLCRFALSDGYVYEAARVICTRAKGFVERSSATGCGGSSNSTCSRPCSKR